MKLILSFLLISNIVFSQTIEECNVNEVDYQSIEIDENYNSRSSFLMNNNETLVIPVVVHVLKNGTSMFNNMTIGRIKEWLEYTNKLLGYPNSINVTSAKMPFMYKLATIDENGNAINGDPIYFYDAQDLIPNYATQSNPGGAQSYLLKNVAYWDPRSYLNIYIGYLSTNFGNFPSHADQMLGMAVSSVGVNIPTGAHEFGHTAALNHSFSNCNSTETNCNSQGDLVCDTSPHADPYTVGCKLEGVDINPCTGLPFDDIQRNVMSYGCTRDKFTPGQAERAYREFMKYRNQMVNSPQTKPFGEMMIPDLLVPKPASCKPTQDYTMNTGGIKRVIIGTINNVSFQRTTSVNVANLMKEETGKYFDYTSINKRLVASNFRTNLDKNVSNRIIIEIADPNNTLTSGYIDFNDDGVLSEDERIFSARNNSGTRTFDFNTPSNVVINKPLRLRVISTSDSGTITSCTNSNAGQIEDYSVLYYDSNAPVTNENGKGLFNITIEKEN